MVERIRKRHVLVAALSGAAFATLGSAAASPGTAPPTAVAARAATGGGMLQLLESSEALGRLKAQQTYAARTFPIRIAVTAPDSSWAGAQYDLTSHGRPAFGWVVLGHPGPKGQLGEIDVETAFDGTPSVAAILARLRSAGGGATYGQTRRVTVAGRRAWQIDGRAFGRFGHVFVPFTPKTGGASPPDNLRIDQGERFRLIVLDVRGKRVVIFLVCFALPPEQFPAFLDSARPLLASLRFPA